MERNPIIVVANTGEDSLSIIDSDKYIERQRIVLPVQGGPYFLAGTDQAFNILITQYYNDTMLHFDLLNNKVLDTFILGRRPSYIANNIEKKAAYVSNADSNTISIVCMQKLKLVSQISVGSMPQGIDYNITKPVMAVANVHSSDIWIIDTDSYQVIKVIKLEGYPFQVKYSTNGKELYVGCSCPEKGETGIIIFMDTIRYEKHGEVEINGIPGQLYNTRDGRYLLTTSMGQGGLQIIDVIKKRVSTQISTNGMTHGMALDSNEKYVYVSNSDDASISIVDWELGEEKKVLVGKEPNGILYVDSKGFSS